MKKQVIAALVLVAAAIGATTPSWAFQSTQKTPVTASAFVGGTKSASFTLSFRDVVSGVARSSVTWSNVNAGDSWKIADTVMVINSTVTDNNGGIQIYTDNAAVGADPRFVDPTQGPDPRNLINSDSAAAGLVQGVPGSNLTSGSVLPVAWSIKDSLKVVGGSDPNSGIGAADPNGTASGAANSFQWLFVTDRYNKTNGVDFTGDGTVGQAGDSLPWNDGDAYQSMFIGSSLHTQQGPTSLEPVSHGTNAYVYMEANFVQANVQTAYTTTALRVEAYIQ